MGKPDMKNNNYDDENYCTVNNGFWDRPPEERAAIMERACDRGGVDNFFDLSPEERGRAYEGDSVQ